jgi:hypothetical protein
MATQRLRNKRLRCRQSYQTVAQLQLRLTLILRNAMAYRHAPGSTHTNHLLTVKELAGRLPFRASRQQGGAL